MFTGKDSDVRTCTRARTHSQIIHTVHHPSSLITIPHPRLWSQREYGRA